MHKKTIAIFAVCMVLVAALSVFTTLALLQDSKTVTNTFTSGSVTITLDEAPVDEDGKVIENEERRIENNYKIYPGSTYTKDPMITNTGSEKAWVGATVVISSKEGAAQVNNLTPTAYLASKGVTEGNIFDAAYLGITPNTGWVLDADKTKYDVESATYTLTYRYDTAALATGGTATLFNSFTVNSGLDNDMIKALGGIKITVNGYAVQEENYTSAQAALSAGFDGVFSAPVQQG